MFVSPTVIMVKYSCSLLLLLIPVLMQAQHSIDGQVRDAHKQSVSGASVSIKDSYDGAVTDASGKFSFSTHEKELQVLVVTAIGYKSLEQKIDLNHLSSLDIILKEEISEMKAVVITAGSFEASDKKRATVLNSIDILTTASANADVTGALKTLPGAQQVGESEGLFVRGGTAAETKTYIDGTLVNNFFYSSVPNISQRGRFTPWLFKGTVFSAGGYSALYGQALSSALILESVDLPERSSGNFGISFLGISAGYQKLSKKKNASWGFSYGYTNLALAFKVLKQKPEYFNIPQYHTGDANFRIKTSSTGILKYYGYFSQNRVGVRNASVDSFGYQDAFRLRNFNMYHNLAWKENLGRKWKLNAGISFANNKDDIKGSLQNTDDQDVQLSGLEYKNFLLDVRGRYVNAKTVFERRWKGLSAFRFGSEYNYSKDQSEFTTYNGKLIPSTIRENLFSTFAETDIYLTNNLAAKLGGRLEHSSLLGQYNVAPRISLAQKVGKESQVSLAYGLFYQDPEKRYLPAQGDITFSKATHYIAQFQKVASNLTFRAEVYYKKYNDLLKTSLINYREVAVSNKGKGYAKGFELFWRDRRTFKNFDYWISYSYIDTKRDFLNYPGKIRPAFAATHTANLVVKKFVTKLKTQFNANYVFASGRPYYNIRYNNTDGKYAIYDQGKTIPYNSLSFSMNYLPNVFKKGAGKFTVFVFSVTNVLGSRQVFGYQYSYNGYRKEAIVPPTKTFIYIGAFINFGVDRRQDVINSNL